MRELIAGALPPAAGVKYAADDGGEIFAKPRAARGGVGFALAAFDEGLLDESRLLEILRSGIGGVYQEQTIDAARIQQYVREFQPRPGSKLPALLDEILQNITKSG